MARAGGLPPLPPPGSAAELTRRPSAPSSPPRRPAQAAVLWSGESIGEAVARLGAVEGGLPSAVLFNCCPVEVIAQGLQILRPLYAGQIGGYGNRRGARSRYGADSTGQIAEAAAAADGPDFTASVREDLDPAAYAAWTREWVAKSGASVVGGCCGIGPGHIAAVHAEMGPSARPRL